MLSRMSHPGRELADFAPAKVPHAAGQYFREQSLAAQPGQWLLPGTLPAACGTHCYLGISVCVGGTGSMVCLTGMSWQ